jgi:hypothetical protein
MTGRGKMGEWGTTKLRVASSMLLLLLCKLH